MGKYQKKVNKWSARLYYGVLILLLILFLVSGSFVLRYWLESKETGDHYDALSSIVESVRQEQETAPTQSTQTEPTEPGILPEYAALYEKNDHMVGWIQIDGTAVNYPVVQSPDSPNYYLRRNFDRQDNSHGCIYVNENCDVNEPSDNVTIYGHFMKDGSMFADLGNYTDPDYLADHKYIRFDTLTQRRTYEIFAVFKTTASVGEGFEYHNFINASSEEDFDWFIRQCKELDLYDTGITPEYGDKIICLSTCEYSVVNGRLVVAAVLMDE